MKNKKKTDLRSGAKAAAEKPISNIDKNDKAVILARMHEIKKYKDDISSTQNTIGYTQMFKDGSGRRFKVSSRSSCGIP